MAVSRLAPEDLHEIVARVSSSQELISGIATQLQQALAPPQQDVASESDNQQHTSANNQQPPSSSQQRLSTSQKPPSSSQGTLCIGSTQLT